MPSQVQYQTTVVKLQHYLTQSWHSTTHVLCVSLRCLLASLIQSVNFERNPLASITLYAVFREINALFGGRGNSQHIYKHTNTYFEVHCRRTEEVQTVQFLRNYTPKHIKQTACIGMWLNEYIVPKFRVAAVRASALLYGRRRSYVCVVYTMMYTKLFSVLLPECAAISRPPRYIYIVSIVYFLYHIQRNDTLRHIRSGVVCAMRANCK